MDRLTGLLQSRYRTISLTVVPAAFMLIIAAAGAVTANLATSDSGEALYPYLERGKLGFMDPAGKTQIKPKYLPVVNSRKQAISRGNGIVIETIDDNSYFRDGMARIRIPKKWWIFTVGHQDAYIDRMGYEVFVSEYPWLGNFSDGVAPYKRRVGDNEIFTHNFYGYVDKEGEEICGAQFEWCGAFHEGLAPVLVGEGYGFIKRETLDRLQFDRFVKLDSVAPFDQSLLHIPARFSDVSEFNGGVAPASIDRRSYGLIDTSGAWVVQPAYQLITHFSDGIAAVYRDHKYGFIRLNGDVIVEPSLDYAFAFNNGLAPVVLNGRYGMIDSEGEMRVPAKYEALGTYSEGLIAFREDYEWGYINVSGDVVIPARFTYADQFYGDLAQVWIDDEMGYIDRKGDWVRRPSR